MRETLILYIQPGKPAQNAYIERFNRTYREAILDIYFKNIQEVQQLTAGWIKHYNEERPHEALNNLTPMLFEKKLRGTSLFINWGVFRRFTTHLVFFHPAS